MSERSEEHELTALASALRDLRPRAETLDHAALMYRAGRASARSRAWPAATATAVALAAVLGVLLLLRPAPPVVERVVYLPAAQPEAPVNKSEDSIPTPSHDAQPGAWSHYVHLQEQVLLQGLDGLPVPPRDSQEEPPSLDSLFPSL